MSNPPEIWVKVCRELEKVITPDALHRWFSSIVPLSYEGGRLVLGVENAIYQYWIEENYLNQLRECATLAVGREHGLWRGCALLVQRLPDGGEATAISRDSAEEDDWRRAMVLMGTLSREQRQPGATVDGSNTRTPSSWNSR